jgi:thioredoxin reductase
VFSNVSLLDINNDGLFNIETNNEIYHSKIVIVASGTKARKFTYFVIPDEIAGMVFYEVFPLLNKRDKKIIIVGAGDAAFDYALNLSKHNRITILNRTNRIKCLPLLWERAQDNENIKYASESSIFQVSYALQGGIMVEYKRIGGTFSLHADYLIGAIGRKPQLEFLSSQVQHHQTELQSQGLLYFIGDVKNEIYRQTSIAVGDGVKAAMQIYNQKKENHP